MRLVCRFFCADYSFSKQASHIKPKFQLLAPSLALSESNADTQQANGFAASPPSIVE
jgi:hypothetical protein